MFGIEEHVFLDEDGRGPYLRTEECEWCNAPFPEAAATVTLLFDPDGYGYDTRVVCGQCDRHGPPMSSRRARKEAADRLETNMSLLERLGWALIHRARR